MSKKYKNLKDSGSSTSSDDGDEPDTKDDSRSLGGEERANRGRGQNKRFSEGIGATSGNVPGPIYPPGKDCPEEYCSSPKKKFCEKPTLPRGKRFECEIGEDSNPALNCPMRHLKLEDKSEGKRRNEPQLPGNTRPNLRSTTQSPKMSHLAVPARGSEVQPTSSEAPPASPKSKGLSLRGVLGYVAKLRPSSRSPDKGSPSKKADPKSKPKTLKVNPMNPNPAKSGASSSSSSSLSKKGESSPDRSMPSTSSSDPNVEYSRLAKKNQRSKSAAESSSASTSDDSRRKRVETSNVPLGSGGHRSSPSSSQQSGSRHPCICKKKPKDYKDHERGCPVIANRIRKRNNWSSKKTYAIKSSSRSSGAASSGEFARATRSSSKLKRAASPRAPTHDPSQPGTSRGLYVPSPSNSPNRSDETSRSPSPSRRYPSRSPSASRSSHRQPSPHHPCLCSPRKRARGQHDDSCPCWSSSRRR